MEQIINLLAKADVQLKQIAVSGADAYRMVNARTLLKAAFDALQQPTEQAEQEVTDDG